MPTIEVDSLDDPRLEPYRDLKVSGVAADRGLFVAEGRWLVLRLLDSDFETESVLVDSRRLADVAGCVPAEVPLLVARGPLIEQIFGFTFHRGVVACGRRRAPPDAESLLGRRTRAELVVVCIGVQDAENLGGILRNAAAFGADAVLLGPGCCDPFRRRVVRVSMGTVFKLPVIPLRDVASDLQMLRDSWGWHLAATVLDDDAQPLERATRPPRLALLLGGEADGLPKGVFGLCHQRLTIPMSAGVDSLNVAVTSGVFLYHFTRQAVKSP